MKRPLSLVTIIPLFLPSVSSAPCSICTDVQQSLSEANNNNNNNLANPDAILPLHLENDQASISSANTASTCQELDQQLGLLVPSMDTAEDLEECAAKISEYHTMMDLAGYCGCEIDVTTTNIDASIQNLGCTFCSNSTNPNVVIDFNNGTTVDNNNNVFQWTCGNLVNLAPFVQDTALCQEIQDYTDTCCENDNNGDNGDAVWQQSVMTCTLCGATARAPDGRNSYSANSIMVMGFLNRTIPVLGRTSGRSSFLPQQQTTATTTITCPEINEALSQDPLIVNSDEDSNGSEACANRQTSWMEENDIHLDLRSYCGCPNAPAPRMCDFACGPDDNSLINQDLVVDKWADGTKLTCGDIVSVIPYIVDVDVCQDYQQYQSLCCANFEASCHLCQDGDGASLAHAEKIIPSIQRTCGLMDQYFGTVLENNNNNNNNGEEEACNEYRDIQNNATIVDLEHYCGCPTAPTPTTTCNFCASNTLTNPNLVLRDIVVAGNQNDAIIDKLNAWGIAGNSMTCRAVAELVPMVTNDDFCHDLQYFAPLCCPDFQPTCTICGSTALTRPDAVIPGRNKNETCAEVDQFHFHIIQGNATACNQQRNGFHTDNMDVAAYCGCPGQDPPNQCNFCDSQNLMDSELVIGIGSEAARTCGYLAEMAPYIVNQTLCDWLEFAKPQCCQPTIPEETCSICTESNGSSESESSTMMMSRPDNVVEHQTGTTCQELEETIRQLPNNNICEQVKGDWDFDLESFCGCPGGGADYSVGRTNRRCELCGDPTELRNHSMALPNKPSWTCAMGQQQAPFVNSKVVCEMEIQTKENIEVCCGPAAGGAGSSSSNNSTAGDDDDENNKIKTAMDKAGLSDTMLWLATLVEVLVIMVFLLLRKHDQVNLQMVTPVQPNLAPAGLSETAALI